MGMRKFCFVCSKSIYGAGIQVRHVSENTRTIHTKCIKPLLKKDLGWQLSTPLAPASPISHTKSC